MEVALDRDALYYPYIHVRDVNWLKATLLCFPQVRRIVPKDFSLRDLPEVQPFLSLNGARGEPLVSEEPAYLYSAYQAQERLRVRLQNSPPDLLAKYSRTQTVSEYGTESDSFLIHAGKIEPLLDFLRSRDIAWPAREVRADRLQEWFAVHPKLGEAIMSVIAIAIAEEKQLDIVTSSGRIHRALACLDEEAVFANILAGDLSMHKAAASSADMVDSLAQVVMLTKFDCSKLSAAQIAELQKDGKDLRRFKNQLLTITQSIPDIRDPAEREKRLKQAADQVIAEWETYRRSLPRFAAEALVSAGGWKPPDLAVSLIAGATSTLVLASGVGFLLGLGVYTGFAVWRGYKEKASSPYQFLNKIEAAGVSLTGRLVPAA